MAAPDRANRPASPRRRFAEFDEWKTTTRAQRSALGKAERKRVPRRAHAEFDPAPGRDPLALLERQAASRVPALVPIRYGRMSVSPFTFYRGAALPMAADLSTTPTTDLSVQLCGDAHLSNFGVFASPERHLVFDVNDFDETHPGPFEWDVKRLAASIVVAGRANGFGPKATRAAAVATVAAYRATMRRLAHRPVLSVWYLNQNVERELERIRRASHSWSKRQRKNYELTQRVLAKARGKDNTRAARRLTVQTGNGTRLVNDPPLIIPIDHLVDNAREVYAPVLEQVLARYRSTLRGDRRRLIDHFSLVDMAHKVVGVGSVGTRAWVLLMQNADADENLILQAKEAQKSVLADYVRGARYSQQGQRVVLGQLTMQSSSDILLGWLRAPGDAGTDVDYYVRQLWDWKGSLEVESLDPGAMTSYGRLCAWTLARAHARSGNRVAIAAYLGESDAFDQAVAEFAVRYADQTELDHAALLAAVSAGRITADTTH
jgi:uncharacterized protein (DUF2252 family)